MIQFIPGNNHTFWAFTADYMSQLFIHFPILPAPGFFQAIIYSKHNTSPFLMSHSYIVKITSLFISSNK